MTGEQIAVPYTKAPPRTGPDLAATLGKADALCWMTVDELGALFRDKEASPVDVVHAVLVQAEFVNDRHNAFTFLDRDGAVAAARESERRWMRGEPLGPLDGVPTTIKDLMTVRRWPTRFGSRVMPNVPAEADAPSVEALRRAGAILIGATTTPEFGWKAVADSPLFGATSNPWDGALTCGGSSGGAAVAALTGCGSLHLGTDGGGSVRIPASFTSVVGHKSSFGRVPYHPPSAFGTVGHIGPIARNAIDAALMLDAMTIRDARDWNQPATAFASAVPREPQDWQGLRIGLWLTPIIGDVAPDILEAISRITQQLEQAGAMLEPIELPGGDVLTTFNVLWFSGAANRVSRVAEKDREYLDPGLLRVAEIGASFSAAEYAAALLHRSVFGSEMDRLLEEYDFLISPTTPVAPFPIGYDVPPNSAYQHWTEWACFNFPINLSQQPACSVPIDLTSDGLPIGLQIIGARGEDAAVLRCATQIAELVGEVAKPSLLVKGNRKK